MNIFIIFFLQNFSKIFSKTHQIAPFLKMISGEHMPLNPPSKRCMALCAMKIPQLLHKYFEPPRNEILDTPLCISIFSKIVLVDQ